MVIWWPGHGRNRKSSPLIKHKTITTTIPSTGQQPGVVLCCELLFCGQLSPKLSRIRMLYLPFIASHSALRPHCKEIRAAESFVRAERLIYSPFWEFKRAAGIPYPATLLLPFILCLYRIYFTWHLIRCFSTYYVYLLWPRPTPVGGRWKKDHTRQAALLIRKSQRRRRPIYPRMNWPQ